MFFMLFGPIYLTLIVKIILTVLTAIKGQTKRTNLRYNKIVSRLGNRARYAERPPGEESPGSIGRG